MTASPRGHSGEGTKEGTHGDIVHGAQQQVSVGVTVNLGLSLKHHSLIVQRFNDLWLLLGWRGQTDKKYNFK